MEIDKMILAHLLEIPREDARGKIIACCKKNNIKIDDKSDPTCESSLLSETCLVDIDFALKNIREKFLQSQSTRAWIIEYAGIKMKPNKAGLMPKSISIPPVLRRLLPMKTREQIVDLWIENYPTAEKLNITFKA